MNLITQRTRMVIDHSGHDLLEFVLLTKLRLHGCRSTLTDNVFRRRPSLPSPTIYSQSHSSMNAVEKKSTLVKRCSRGTVEIKKLLIC